MSERTPASPGGDVRLRDVVDGDLPAFFEFQLNAEANRLAAFKARDRASFMAHWRWILEEEAVVKQTILFEGQVAGNIVSFEQAGEREVGYWIGRDFWGKGVATRALAAFLDHETRRPLYGYVARHNLASARVLDKCGFRLHGEISNFGVVDGEEVDGLILVLEADGPDAS